MYVIYNFSFKEGIYLTCIYLRDNLEIRFIVLTSSKFFFCNTRLSLSLSSVIAHRYKDQHQDRCVENLNIKKDLRALQMCLLFGVR